MLQAVVGLSQLMLIQLLSSSPVLSNTVPPLMNWMVGGGTPLAVQVMTVSSVSFTVITAPSNGSEMFGATGI